MTVHTELHLLSGVDDLREWEYDNLGEGDGHSLPDTFPCYVFTTVKSWRDELIAVKYVYKQDLQKMLEDLLKEE